MSCEKHKKKSCEKYDCWIPKFSLKRACTNLSLTVSNDGTFYTLQVINNGPIDAKNIILNISYISTGGFFSNYPATTTPTTITINLPNLQIGETLSPDVIILLADPSSISASLKSSTRICGSTQVTSSIP